VPTNTADLSNDNCQTVDANQADRALSGSAVLEETFSLIQLKAETVASSFRRSRMSRYCFSQLPQFDECINISLSSSLDDAPEGREVDISKRK